MNEKTKLPDGLELAPRIIEEAGWIDDATARASNAIRAEHAQRLTLQHHAADMAQRVADLEVANAALLERVGTIEGDNQRLEVERDALRARLTGIEAQEPVMYVLRSAAKRPQPAVVKQKKYLSCAISDLVDMGLEHLDPLFTRPVPAQAVPAGCGACGDGCARRGSCRLADESPEHKA